MKTLLQLAIDVELKKRLENFKNQTGIPYSKIIEDLLSVNIEKLEQRYGVQTSLKLDQDKKLTKK